MSTRYDEMRGQVIRFHKERPIVWDLFVRFAFNRINAGFNNYSAKGVFERIRWETARTHTGDDAFKINNNYSAFYARAFMRKYPRHEGFFRTRKQISNDQTDTGLPELRPSHFDSEEKAA